MAIYTAPQAEGYNPAPSIHSAAEVHVAQGYIDGPAGIVVGDIIKLCKLPAGCIPIDARLELDDVDSGAGAIVVDLALMELGDNDVVADSELIQGSTIGQAGGVARMDKLTAARRAVLQQSVERQRYVVAKVTTGPSTGQAGRWEAHVLFRGKEYNE